jgi:hypothetical protein
VILGIAKGIGKTVLSAVVTSPVAVVTSTYNSIKDASAKYEMAQTPEKKNEAVAPLFEGTINRTVPGFIAYGVNEYKTGGDGSKTGELTGNIVAEAAITYLTAKPTASLISVKTVGGATTSTGTQATKETVFRVFGGDSRAQGFSWTPLNIKNIKSFRDGLGLPSGGKSGANNTADFLIKGTVDPKNIITKRSALPLDGNKGGLPEYIIDPKNVEIIDFSVLNP